MVRCGSLGDAFEKGNEKPNVNPFQTKGIHDEEVESASMIEIELRLVDGIILRGQKWSTHSSYQNMEGKDDKELAGTFDGDIHQEFRKKETQTRILALHGWLDNCRSFYYLAPKIVERLEKTTNTTVEVVAIDLPGHGWSSHRPIDGPTAVLSEGVYYIAEIIDALGWNENEQKVSLIGHSMGGGMAVTYAGVFPEQIMRIVSLDMFGPEPGKPEQAAADIRAHVEQRRSPHGPLGRSHALYPSLERAIERRMKAATLAPGGHQYLSLEASTELVTRSTTPVYEDDDNNSDEGMKVTSKLKGFRFRHDARMLWPSLQYSTAEQIESILGEVECDVCLLVAQDGYPFAQDCIERAVTHLRPSMYEILPGSHHFHADPDTADAVVDKVCEFFQSRTRRSEPMRKGSTPLNSLEKYGMQ